ncbi:hypothetical protein Tco_0447810 [Tanacetum coccineum]
MQSPLCVENKIRISPPDYSKENLLATFAPQRNLTPEQIFWSIDDNRKKAETLARKPISTLTVYPPNTPVKLVPRILPTKSQVKINLYVLTQLFTEFDKTCKTRITPSGLTEGERGFEQTKRCYLTEVIPFFKTLKEHFVGVQTALFKEVKEMEKIFDQMNNEVDQNSVDKQCAEIEKKNLLIENENLIVNCLSTQLLYDVAKSRCLDLEADVSKVHDESKLISKLEREYLNLQLKYQHLQESFDNKKSQASQEAPDFRSFFKIKNLEHQIQEKDNVIGHLKDIVTNVKARSREPHSAVDVTALIEQNNCDRLELEKVKQHYKELFDSIKILRAHTSEKTSTMLNEIESLKAQLRSKEPCFTSDYVKPKVLAPGMYAIDVKPIPHPLKNNRSAHLNYIGHLKESVETVREIVEEARAVKPLDSSLNYACRYTKLSQELLECVLGTCPKNFNERDNKAPSTPVTRKKQVTFSDKPGTSSSNTQKHKVHQRVQLTNIPVLPSTGVNDSTEASGSKPRSNTKKNRILPAKKENKKEVEVRLRTNRKEFIGKNLSVVLNEDPQGKKFALGEICQLLSFCENVLHLYATKPTGCSKHMMGNRSKLMNFVEKFIGSVRFGNDHLGAIMGFGDYVMGDSWPSKAYYCFVVIVGYSISLKDENDEVFLDILLSQSFQVQIMVVHRRLNHLNFGFDNDLCSKYLVRGLPRLKFKKDHLCSALDLCGPIESPGLASTKQSGFYPHKITDRNSSTKLMSEYYEGVGHISQKSVREPLNKNGSCWKDVIVNLVDSRRTMIDYSRKPHVSMAEAVATVAAPTQRAGKCVFQPMLYIALSTTIAQDAAPSPSAFIANIDNHSSSLSSRNCRRRKKEKDKEVKNVYLFWGWWWVSQASLLSPPLAALGEERAPCSGRKGRSSKALGFAGNTPQSPPNTTHPGGEGSAQPTNRAQAVSGFGTPPRTSTHTSSLGMLMQARNPSTKEEGWLILKVPVLLQLNGIEGPSGRPRIIPTHVIMHEEGSGIGVSKHQGLCSQKSRRASLFTKRIALKTLKNMGMDISDPLSIHQWWIRLKLDEDLHGDSSWDQTRFRGMLASIICGSCGMSRFKKCTVGDCAQFLEIDWLAGLNDTTKTAISLQSEYIRHRWMFTLAPNTLTYGTISSESKWVNEGLNYTTIVLALNGKLSGKELLFQCTKDSKEPSFSIHVDILSNTNFFQAFTASANVPAIYLQQFWKTMSYNEKTGVYSCQLDEQWFDLRSQREDDDPDLEWLEVELVWKNTSRKGRRRRDNPVSDSNFKLHEVEGKGKKAVVGVSIPVSDPCIRRMRLWWTDPEAGRRTTGSTLEITCVSCGPNLSTWMMNFLPSLPKVYGNLKALYRRYVGIDGINQNVILVKNQESDNRGPKEIIKAKKEQEWKKQDSTYSIRSTDKVDHLKNLIKKVLLQSMIYRRSERSTRGKHASDDDEDDDDAEGHSWIQTGSHPQLDGQLTDTRDASADSSMATDLLKALDTLTLALKISSIVGGLRCERKYGQLRSMAITHWWFRRRNSYINKLRESSDSEAVRSQMRILVWGGGGMEIGMVEDDKRRSKRLHHSTREKTTDQKDSIEDTYPILLSFTHCGNKSILRVLRIILVILLEHPSETTVFHNEPARANIKQDLGYLKDGDGDGNSQFLRCQARIRRIFLMDTAYWSSE